MEIRDGEGQKSGERVIEFVSIFSGRVTMGTTSPCSTSFKVHTHFLLFLGTVQGSAPPTPSTLGGVTLQKNVDHSPQGVKEETGAHGPFL